MAKKDHIKDIARILHFYQKTGYLCDTILVAEDGQVKAHSPVLAASSSVFRKSLRHGSSPTLHVIVLPGVDLFVARVIVHFVYTGVIVVPVKYALAGHMKTLVEVLMTLKLISESEAQSFEDVLSKVLSRTPASSHMMYICSSDIQNSDAAEAKSSEVQCIATPQSVIETSATNSITTSYSALHTHTVDSPETGVPQTKNCVGTGLTLYEITSLLVKTGLASVTAADMESSNHSMSPGTVNLLSSNVSSHLLSLSASSRKPQEQQNDASSPGTDIATDSPSLPSARGQEACWFCGGLHRCQASYYCEKATGINCEQKQNLRCSFLCEYCGMVVVDDSKYKAHLATHVELDNSPKSVDDRPIYPCEQCGRILHSHHSLYVHLRKHREKYVCEVCSVSYIQQKSLRQHQLDRHGIFTKSKHPNAFNAQQCSVCLRRFVCRQNFNLHLLCHAREKPYTCELCARHFVTKESLKNHMVKYCRQLKYRR